MCVKSKQLFFVLSERGQHFGRLWYYSIAANFEGICYFLRRCQQATNFEVHSSRILSVGGVSVVLHCGSRYWGDLGTVKPKLSPLWTHLGLGRADVRRIFWRIVGPTMSRLGPCWAALIGSTVCRQAVPQSTGEPVPDFFVHIVEYNEPI